MNGRVKTRPSERQTLSIQIGQRPRARPGSAAPAGASGEGIPNFYRGGLKEEIVKVSPYGEAVSAEARKHADDVKAKLTEGSYTIFKGPIADNKGKTVIASGVSEGQTDPQLEKMDYLVDGVIGATS